ncbi:hypothetical protein FRC11_003519, partial [Ceratobasidium sp. 423]
MPLHSHRTGLDLPIDYESMLNNHAAPLYETTRNPRKVVHSGMTPREIIKVLEAHGCENLSQKLDLSTGSQFPMSSGGLGDIYQGIHAGIHVAIKTRLYLVNKEGEKHLELLSTACGQRAAHPAQVSTPKRGQVAW